MVRRKKKKEIEIEYKTALEKFYDRHVWYRHLVFLSRIARMVLYLLLGFSIVLLVTNGGRLKTFEAIVYDLVTTPIGKIIALFFGILLIIYGIEKPRG
ncbi:MAG: hypothetical protein COY38_01915 [Candidatus Aenigmarchaeota archaeon CG_4_10_14_0_8_um_filter_37_24]|nr:hypothetical protein [Candidatus Aenigmarchaeota archaeon]OIN88028.1 MAG: hypothetical protein AUJ50_01870 [Candidatus Aenigmarchaeota archaeon CG1_02_38_14]PIV68811.1 MAG: hypothetical protein COS07_02935 [Candidatus Aenigmarchaeota archaeon CG01_land_8_20_14_3_00_37_9]PIW41460.1 MAG: hypothetical protein COW21_01785 [Candidatus Aenigmarchaeota archaeon CG15_BIG_FIL_POST_REV_8_21_14_020_37_27]PIX51149.1 MAG: hypothetical protein COZ52_00390 [Candidatus Aenigmarchaeota archaeon CG_4_8_14_3_u